MGTPIVTAVIMAGGRGERFWPKSRKKCPKQFLSLTNDGETMIQKTVNRISGLVKPEHVYIVTNDEYINLVEEQMPQIPKENLLREPAARNTAPCIAFAAAVISKRHGEDAVMLVLPADHLIRHEAICEDVLHRAANAAVETQSLITIGIAPTYPETGYGYIAFSRSEKAPEGFYRVSAFKEKPDYQTAHHYVESGHYLWNSGMFAWQAKTFLQAVQAHLPEAASIAQKLHDACDTDSFEEVLEQEFPKMPSISVDFGVLEHAEELYTISGSFGWDDVGSWPSLQRVARTDENGNYCDGDIMAIDTKECVISGGKKLIAAVGLEHIIVVDTEDALLVCDISDAQNIKKVTELLRAQGREEFL
ncbi:MAG: NTP transferase domain-containing protein [Oscillospiraceae bacterium]|nr:NTP transferase domain-containing protein [Oscillospiraceae bacterium]